MVCYLLTVVIDFEVSDHNQSFGSTTPTLADAADLFIRLKQNLDNMARQNFMAVAMFPTITLLSLAAYFQWLLCGSLHLRV